MNSKQENELNVLADKQILSREERKHFDYLLQLWHEEQEQKEHEQWIASQDDRAY